MTFGSPLLLGLLFVPLAALLAYLWVERRPPREAISFPNQLQTGADPGEGGRLLIDVNLEPDPSQRGGSGQSRDPSTDDRYCRRCIRHRAPTMAAVNSP